MSRLLRAVGFLVAGFALGATGVTVQAGQVMIAGHTLQWGLPVTLFVVFVAVRGASWWQGSRYAGGCVAAGWLLASAMFTTTGPAGDVILPDSMRSTAYLAIGALLAGLGAGLPVTHETTSPTDAVADVPETSPGATA